MVDEFNATDNVIALHKAIQSERYSLYDFWYICPFSKEELLKNRKRTRINYLHVGMVWSRLSGNSLQKTGEIFKRDHSTVVHAEKNVLKSLENSIFGSPEHLQIIEAIKNRCINPEKTEDIWQDYLSSQALMETLITNKLCKNN